MDRINHILILGKSTTEYGKILRRVLPDAVINHISPYGLEPYPRVTKGTLVVFTDGEMIHPMVYGASPLMNLKTNRARDVFETKMYDLGHEIGAKFLGIGRGFLMLWALQGNNLYQQISGHEHGHEIIDLVSGEVIDVNSNHKQGIILNSIHGSTLAIDRSDAMTASFFDIEKGYARRLYANGEGTVPIIEAWTNPEFLGVMWRPDLLSCPVAGLALFYNYLTNFLKGETE